MPGSVRSFNITQGVVTGDDCANPAVISARAVYVGSRIAIYEDLAAPVAGGVDSVLHRLGRDFDQRQFDVLATNFGDPLAMDGRLDANGVVLAVVSDRVGGFGLDGFVVSSDFYPPATCPASNAGEVIYLAAPTSGADVSSWRSRMGGVLIHEGKHETAMAETIARGGMFQEATWLEESSAQIASELWGRAQGGYAQFSNVGWSQSLACEVGDCPGRTMGALDPWMWLYDYDSSLESISLLSDGDYAGPYGGDWFMLRWAIDHSGVAEAAFLRALTISGETGIRNLEHRSGMTWSTIMGEFTLANAVDDYPGVTFENPHLTQPSWNSRDIMLNLWKADLTSILQMHKVSYGTFDLAFPAITAGEAALLDLGGAQGAPQAISIAPAMGGRFPNNIQMSIVRVE
jgi:hypothetical protein